MQPVPGSGANTYQTFHNGTGVDDEDDSEDDLRTASDGHLGIDKRALYEPESALQRARRAVLTPRRLCYIAVGVFLCILLVALIATFARPNNACVCPSVAAPSGFLGSHHHPADTNSTETSITTTTTATTSPFITDNGQSFPYNNIRLPPDVSPVSYSIRIHPSLKTRRHAGTVNVTFRVLQPTNFVVMHAKHLNLSDVHLLDARGIRVLRTLQHAVNEQVYVEFDQLLAANEDHVLSIGWVGEMKEGLEGLYISSYRTADGEKRLMATTHFEPTDARSAFPCFDEPALKAKFRVAIVRSANYTSISNMPLNHTEELTNELLVDHFDESVPMSTYLVAFIVSDFANKTAKTIDGIKVSVFAPPHLIDQVTYSLDVAVKSLEYFNTYFGIAYPIAKHDLIAIPDFSAGAMENWGLSTYRDTSLMADINKTSLYKLQTVATVICHELAHQWFGNLVTMEWWNDLWLNEGFATFMEYQCADAIKTDWKMDEQFLMDSLHPALQLDSLITSHPISVEVNDPSQITSIFDDISYKKGSSIMNMLKGFLGKSTLRKGLQAYLKKYKFDNANTKDLWDAFSQESNNQGSIEVDVTKVMDTWTQQMGFPLINISRHGDAILATQKRFLIGANETDQDDGDTSNATDVSVYGYKWIVPLTCYTDQDPHTSTLHWMNMTDASFDIKKSVQWIKCNINQTGFYRVTYEDSMWRKIGAALKNNHLVFSAADRTSLLDDAFSLSRNMQLDPRIALELTDYLVNETEMAPWVTALQSLSTYKHNLEERPCFIYLEQFIRDLLAPIVKKIGWNDVGTHTERLLRPIILSYAMTVNNQDVIDKAVRMFKDWKTNGTRIPPALHSIVYKAGITYGNYDDWQYCWKYYQNTTLTSEQDTMRTVLGASRDHWVLSQYLDIGLQPDKIRPQNTQSIISVVANNPIGRDMTWRFVRMHWQEIFDRYGTASFTMRNIISNTVGRFTTTFDLHEVEEFFAEHDAGTGKRAVKDFLEKIKSNIRWLEHSEQIVESWLKSRLNVA